MARSSFPGDARATGSRWRCAALPLGMLGILLACDSVTEPVSAAQPRAEVTQSRVDGSAASLPVLIRRAREEVRSGGHPEGEMLLRQARELSMEARAARREGDRERAVGLREESRDAVLSAVVEVLGAEAVGEAIDQREEALRRMTARLEDRPPRPQMAERIEARLSRAGEGVAEARVLLDGADALGALKSLDERRGVRPVPARRMRMRTPRQRMERGERSEGLRAPRRGMRPPPPRR